MAAKPSMKDYWSEGAATYAEFSGLGGLLPLHEKVIALTASHLTADKSKAFLDVACGDGEPACSLARQNPEAEVLATDFAPGMVEVARKRAESLGVGNIRFAVADAMDLSELENHSFDVVTCVAALFMVPDYVKALQEFKRVVKPGGLVIVTTWGTPEETNIATAVTAARKRLLPDLVAPAKGSSIDPSRLASEESLKGVFAEAGFSRVKTEKFNLVFEFPGESHVYPDGAMLQHPMITLNVSALEAASVPDPLRRLTAEINNVFDEYNYRTSDGNLRFPTNVAVIAIATA